MAAAVVADTAAVTTPRGSPLPPIVHETLTKQRIGDGRIIIVGDIHGCSDELEDLLHKCQHRPGVDTVVSVGDLVGKGPNSLRVLQAARSRAMLTVRGNWDEQALCVLRKLQSGESCSEKWKWIEGLPQAEADYLQHMPFSLSIPSHGCIVTHAGMVPGISLAHQQLVDLIEMRHVDLVDPDGNGSEEERRWQALPKYPREAGRPWATVWPGPEHIIFGHHARRRLQECSFASGIDTGCCLGDQLTALVLPGLKELSDRKWIPPPEGVTRESLGARLVSVPARHQYVMPDED